MPKLFDDLRERLLSAGVAPRHVRRYLRELADHLEELRDQQDSEAAALARLGDVEQLAKPMLDKPEFRSLTARAPWAVMTLGPIVTMLAIIVAVFLLLVGIGLSFQWPAHGIYVEPMWFQNITQAAVVFLLLVLPVLIGWAAAALAIEQRIGPKWPLIGLTLFAVLSGTFGMEVHFPQFANDPGKLMLGVSWYNSAPLDHVDISPVRWVANYILIVGPYLYRLKRLTWWRDNVLMIART